MSVQFTPLQAVQEQGLKLDPASAQSVARFEQLLYAPRTQSVAASPVALPGTQGNFVQHLERMSDHWRAGQASIDQLSRKGTISMNELLLIQSELINSTVNVEISSKATDILESGVQSLVQRSQ
jgi:hypothetical protein